MNKLLPAAEWLKAYNRKSFANDAVAAVIVTLMLVPQSLAYAMLAGLPAEVGLYASMAPLLAYALFGSSRVLAVGPVAVVSLMTAAALGDVAIAGSANYVAAAATLAALSGGILLLMGVLRLGFIANFLSHPVIAGFITASGILIAASQLKHILGITASGDTLPLIVQSLLAHANAVNLTTLTIGAGAILALFWMRRSLKPLLVRWGANAGAADLVTKAGPIFVLAATTLAAFALQLQNSGVKLVGAVPAGLPAVALPGFSLGLVQQLALPALLVSVVGFVESVSVGQTLAAKRRQRIDPDQELVGLGAANLAASVTGGMPVTGGFARSVVNFDAGAETPAASVFTALGLGIATLFMTPLLAWLPQATLAATIIVAVLSLIDLSILKRSWTYSVSDFAAVAGTILVTLGVGVEAGIVTGVALSILLHLHKTSRPHIAVIGRVPGTEHFRNVKRHEVQTQAHILALRVDESLYFANARFLEDQVYARLAEKPGVSELVLVCPAVNDIDLSALDALESINARLKDAGVRLHFSEVKGPVMDKLSRSGLLEHLTGQIYLSQHDACKALAQH